MILQLLLNILFIPAIFAGTTADAPAIYADTPEILIDQPQNENYDIPRLGDCADIESESGPNDWNIVGLDDDTAQVTLCKPNLHDFYRYAPESTEILTGSVRILIDGHILFYVRMLSTDVPDYYLPSDSSFHDDDGYYYVRINWCEFASMGCDG